MHVRILKEQLSYSVFNSRELKLLEPHTDNATTQNGRGETILAWRPCKAVCE